jgi:N-acetylmuramoyl-L-alanine amidase
MQNIVWKGSPNFWSGRQDHKPEGIVIHIMAGTLIGTDAWFNNPKSQVSAHYGIGKKGEVHQYVKEEDSAWHAGKVSNQNALLVKPNINPNLYTIGIEHEGSESDEWTEEMKNASATLIRDICIRWNIPIDRNHIIGHYQITSKKPNCPAINKNIVDELVALATGQQQADIPSAVEEGIKKIEDGLIIIKRTLR